MIVTQHLGLRPYWGGIKFAWVFSGSVFFDNLRGKFSFIMLGQVFFHIVWVRILCELLVKFSLIIVGQVFVFESLSDPVVTTQAPGHLVGHTRLCMLSQSLPLAEPTA